MGQCMWDGAGVYACSLCVAVGGWVGQCVWVGAGVYAGSVCCLRAHALNVCGCMCACQSVSCAYTCKCVCVRAGVFVNKDGMNLNYETIFTL